MAFPIWPNVLRFWSVDHRLRLYIFDSGRFVEAVAIGRWVLIVHHRAGVHFHGLYKFWWGVPQCCCDTLIEPFIVPHHQRLRRLWPLCIRNRLSCCTKSLIDLAFHGRSKRVEYCWKDLVSYWRVQIDIQGGYLDYDIFCKDFRGLAFINVDTNRFFYHYTLSAARPDQICLVCACR